MNRARARGTPAAPTLASLGGAPLASPALTGVPTAPTAAAATNTTQLATTAFVQTEIAAKAPLASPTFTGTPAAPTAAPGANTTQVATTAFVTAAIAAIPAPTSVVRYAVPLTWFRTNIAANLPDEALGCRGGGFVWKTPRAGGVVGISVNFSGVVTAGSMDVNVVANGVEKAIHLLMAPGSNDDGGTVTGAAAANAYAANVQLFVQVTTSADFEPAGSATPEIWIYVEETP